VSRNRLLVIAAVILGVVLLVVAAIYFAEPAKSLLALGCFAFAWFQSGPAASGGRTAT